MSEALRILVIDDDEVDRHAVRRALLSANLLGELIEADGAEAGLEAAASAELDCILLDFHMPRRTGMDVLRALREDERHRTTPVIVLTGHGDEQLAVVLMKAGATDYLAKSALTAERLEQSVRHALRMQAAEREAREAQGALARYTAQLTELAVASTEVSARVDSIVILRAFAARARKLFDASRAVVTVLHPEEREQLLHLSSDPAQPQLKSPGAGFKAALACWTSPAFLSREELLRELPLAGLIEGSGLGLPSRSWLGAVIPSPDGPVGLVHAVDLAAPASDNDKTVLAHLAQILGVALDNARLVRGANNATRLRDEVMAVVSHDLRNPLHVISFAAGLMRVDATPRQRSQLEKIQRGVEQSNRLIEDLLDVTRIEAGRLSLELSPQVMKPLLEEAVDQLRPLADEKKVALSLAQLTDLPVVEADRARVGQVLTNLVGNSLKFTPPGGRITIDARKHDAEVVVSVRDTGSGIKPEHLPHVFDRFWQADANRGRGAGLGLAIVQGIIQSHGGRVWIESQLGLSTTVSFTLPPARQADVTRPANPA